MIKYLLVFLLCPAIAFAGTITGIAKKDGTVWQGAIVRCYLYNNAVANVATLADSDTTAADGSYTLTTTNTQTHLLIIIDPDDIKKAIIKVVTPDAD